MRIAPPKDFGKVVDGVERAIERLRLKCKHFKVEAATRGDFASVAFGILYGGGQTVSDWNINIRAEEMKTSALGTHGESSYM